jgi:hypothetical protein
MSEKMSEGLHGDVLRGYAGDEDGVCLDGLGMGGLDEMLLTLDQEVRHFLSDIVAYPRFT